MSVKPRDFSAILTILGNTEQPLDAATIYGLSGLDSAQAAQLARQWASYPVERRRKLLQHLNMVSEGNFEMDFHAVNYIAIEDPDSEVRQYAIEGLWEDESIKLMHRLVDIAHHDPSLEVRAAAISELGRFILLGEYEEISHADARLAQNSVWAILNSDEDNELRRKALEAIANCGREGVHERIREFYRHDDLKMRMSAIFAMGCTCDSLWASDILNELDSEIPEMQYEAARAAGRIELEEAIPHLVRLTQKTEDTEILEISIWSLGEIGGEEARRALNRIAARAEANNDEEILTAAQDALDSASLPGDFMLFDFDA